MNEKLNKLLNKKLHIDVNNKESEIEQKNESNKLDINIVNNNKENNNTNKNNMKKQLNYLSFSNKEETKRINSPSNSIILSAKEGNKKETIYNKDNSILSLQKYLNYSKQKRIKFGGGNKNTFYIKDDESNNKENKNEKGSNLSGLDPSISSFNNNFKKIGTRNDEKKNLRSSSVCYSSNNHQDKSHDKKLMNKTNCLI